LGDAIIASSSSGIPMSVIQSEVVYLIGQGVLDVADSDDAVSSGPGLRWGVMGPNFLWHLGHQEANGRPVHELAAERDAMLLGLQAVRAKYETSGRRIAAATRDTAFHGR
jgi:carnitine 3-dehydrogenase